MRDGDVPLDHRLTELRGKRLEALQLLASVRHVAGLERRVDREVRRLRGGQAVAGAVGELPGLAQQGGAHRRRARLHQRDGHLREHPRERPRIADAARHRERVAGELRAPLPVAVADELERELCEQAGARRAVGVWQHGQRRFEHRYAIAVDALRRAVEAAVVRQRGTREPCRVAHLRGQRGRPQERRAMRRVAGHALRLALRDRQLAALRLAPRRAAPVEHVDRMPVVRARLLVGEQRERPLAGEHGVADRPVEVLVAAGQPEMVGQLGEAVLGIDGAGLLDRGGHTAMQERAARGGQRPVEHVTDQGVREAVAAVARGGLLDELRADGSVERVDEVVLADVAEPLEQLEGERLPDDGRRLEHAGRLGAEMRQAAADEVAHALGHGALRRRRTR